MQKYYSMANVPVQTKLIAGYSIAILVVII